MKFKTKKLLTFRTFLREQGATHEQIKSVIDSARYHIRYDEDAEFAYHLPVSESKIIVIYTRDITFYRGVHVRIEHYEKVKFDL